MNENKLALITTLTALGLALAAILVLASLAPSAPGAGNGANDDTVSRYARMFQERNRLQARVNYCERQQQEGTPAYRRVCDEAELAKLDEYRKRIGEIDAELAKLRETAPTPAR